MEQSYECMESNFFKDPYPLQLGETIALQTSVQQRRDGHWTDGNRSGFARSISTDGAILDHGKK